MTCRTAGTGPELRNKERFPTYSSMAVADSAALNGFLIALLEKYHWTTVFILCDTNNQVIAFYKANCGALKQALRRNPTSNFTVEGVSFDSGADGSTRFREYSRRIKSSARGKFQFINII